MDRREKTDFIRWHVDHLNRLYSYNLHFSPKNAVLSEEREDGHRKPIIKGLSEIVAFIDGVNFTLDNTKSK